MSGDVLPGPAAYALWMDACALARDWTSPPGVEEWVPVSLAPDPDHGVAATPAKRGAGSVSQLARAQAWWRIPAGRGQFSSGSVIEVRPLAGGD
jgi:molybdopterin biosynthesis enzyme